LKRVVVGGVLAACLACGGMKPPPPPTIAPTPPAPDGPAPPPTTAVDDALVDLEHTALLGWFEAESGRCALRLQRVPGGVPFTVSTLPSSCAADARLAISWDGDSKLVVAVLIDGVGYRIDADTGAAQRLPPLDGPIDALAVGSDGVIQACRDTKDPPRVTHDEVVSIRDGEDEYEISEEEGLEWRIGRAWALTDGHWEPLGKDAVALFKGDKPPACPQLSEFDGERAADTTAADESSSWGSTASDADMEALSAATGASGPVAWQVADSDPLAFAYTLAEDGDYQLASGPIVVRTSAGWQKLPGTASGPLYFMDSGRFLLVDTDTGPKLFDLANSAALWSAPAGARGVFLWDADEPPPGGEPLVVAGLEPTDAGCAVVVHDVPGGASRTAATLGGACPANWGVAYAPDYRAVVAYEVGAWRAWEIRLDRHEVAVLPAASERLEAIRYSDDGSLLACVTTGKSAIAWARDGAGWKVLTTGDLDPPPDFPPLCLGLPELALSDAVTVAPGALTDLGEYGGVSIDDPPGTPDQVWWGDSYGETPVVAVQEDDYGRVIPPVMFRQGGSWRPLAGLDAGKGLRVELADRWLLAGSDGRPSQLVDLRTGQIAWTAPGVAWIWPDDYPLPP
jgi:hypothetical protein